MSDQESFVEKLTDKSEDYSRWYTEVILKAQLADYAPVRGCMVIRPYGFALWENIQRLLDARFKATGHVNAYFPLLIPESFLAREAEHVAGFAPEVAWVTQGGSEPLEERLAIRPTSEAIIGHMYSKWVNSWRDLPILVNQWCNVLRWEKVTRLFLRTTEFLWQEGHTVHRTAEEAQEETLRILDIYRSFVEEDLAIPVVYGQKTEAEKFKGAVRTYAIEAMMGDGKALQAGTSHYLGQNFAKVFDITFQDMDGERKYAWQTSWGVSTRLIGAIIMVHGDDSGLIMPPRVAPVQAVVVPIWRKEQEKEAVAEAVNRLKASLGADIRLQVDWDDAHTPGWKYNEHELRGVPIRIEIGPRDVKNNQVVLVRRDTRAKELVPMDGVKARLAELLDQIQRDLLERARRFMAERTAKVNSFEEFTTALEEKRGFLLAHWCGGAECEAKIKDETGATIRCIPLEAELEDGSCVWCAKPSGRRVVFGKAY
ncbi:MAG: proline--tRNA ligase [Sphingomonadaceae bacterium]